MIHIIIAEEHVVVLKGLMSVLRNETSITIVGSATTKKEILALLKGKRARVVLLSDEFPERDELIFALHLLYTDLKILLTTLEYKKDVVERDVRLKIDGMILKDASGKDFAEAIQIVHGGEDYFEDFVKQLIFKMTRKEKSRNNLKIELTKREKEVLQCLAEDLKTEGIALRLHTRPTTIDTHRKNLLSKFGVNTASGLVKKAIDLGFI